MNFTLLQGHWQAWVGALGLTVLLTLMSALFGLLGALYFTWVRTQQTGWTKKILEIFIFFVRGTPLLIQLFLVYYGTGQLSFIRETWAWEIFRYPLPCAILAFALNSACYTSEIFVGFLRRLPKQFLESGIALGMSRLHVFRYILLPHLLSRTLPAYSNEVIIILKSTALASTITLLELTGLSRELIATTNAALEGLVISGLFYLFLNTVVLLFFKYLMYRYRPQAE